MNEKQLGSLTRVELRDIWYDEAGAFTPWLATPENLQLLGQTLGLELEYEDQETRVGSFRADISARDTSDGSWVLIENQLERTDHLHLGQLLTYAAGLEAVTIVWVSAQFRDEHRGALDWLNEITDDRFRFFGLEIELWRIGDSVSAPKFNVVSKPNDWTATIQAAARDSEAIGERQQLQLEFWSEFRAYMDERSSIRCSKPQPQSWMYHPLERTGVHLSSNLSSWNSATNKLSPEIRVELYMDGRDAKSIFAMLQAQNQAIQSELDETLIWYNNENNKSCRIYARKDAEFTDRETRTGCFEWLKWNLEAFDRAFSPRVRVFDGSAFNEATDAEA